MSDRSVESNFEFSCCFRECFLDCPCNITPLAFADSQYFSHHLVQFLCVAMSLFSKTSAQVDQLESKVKELDEASSSKPLAERKQLADSISHNLTEMQPAVDKFVSKAEAGERDPNKRIYGTAMVSKIFALRDRFEAISSLFTSLQTALLDEWSAHEKEKLEEESRRVEEEKQAEKERVEDEQREKERREEEERVQNEKKREEAEKRKAEEEARQKAEQEREAERKRLQDEESVRQKKLDEERAAAEAKKREEEASAAAEAKAKAEKAQQDSKISVSIRTTRGATYFLNDLSIKATVKDLKEAIERNYDVAKAAQRLIFQGRLLADPNPIESYKIKDGSVVHLVENPRAAAASASSSAREKPLVPDGTVCHLRNGKEQLDEILKQCGNDRLVVVDWSAPWCGPCRAIAPVFERLATRFSTVTFVKVDTEETAANAQLAAQYMISAYPTFHYLLGQRVMHSFSGANATAIENNIKKYLAVISSEKSNSNVPPGSAGSSTGGSSGSGSGQGSISSRVMSSLLTLRQNLAMSEFVTAVRTLLTFVRNVVNNPGLEKYRKVRTANSTFQNRLGSKQGGMDCMRAFGFEEVTENGERFLVMPARAAAESELRTVMGQLESALEQASGGSATQPRPIPSSTTAPADMGAGHDAGDLLGAGGPVGLRGMFGGGAGGMPNEAMWQLMQDPSFQQVASELATDPEAMGVIMQMQQAMTSGDIGAIQRLRSHPAMGRLQSALINNPTFLSAMMGQMAEQGLPNLGMFGGMGMDGNNAGSTGTGAGTGAVPGTDNAPGTGQGNVGGGGGNNNAERPQATFPGAPTTAEEEERLLQEAIRLSMQDQAGQEKRESGNEDGDGSKDKET